MGVTGDGHEIELFAGIRQCIFQRAVAVGNPAMIVNVAKKRPQAVVGIAGHRLSLVRALGMGRPVIVVILLPRCNLLLRVVQQRKAVLIQTLSRQPGKA